MKLNESNVANILTEFFKTKLSIILNGFRRVRTSKLSFYRFWPGFRLFEAGVRVGSKFGFGERTWVQVSLKFELSSLKLIIFGFDPILRPNSPGPLMDP